MDEELKLWMCQIQHMFKNKFKNDQMYAIMVDTNVYEIHQFYLEDLNHGLFINHLDIQIPNTLIGMNGCGYAHTLDGKYIFICGGYTEHSTQSLSIIDGCRLNHDKIHVLDLIKMKIVLMDITLPSPIKGTVQAICMKNTERDNLIVYGFVNLSKKLYNFMAIFPELLIELLLKYYSTEYLHILQIDKNLATHPFSGCKHYKIDILHLINNIETFCN